MDTWEQILFGPLLLIHGLVHLIVMGAALAAGSLASSGTLGSLARVARHESPLGKAWPVVWLAAGGSLLAGAIGLIGGQAWWRTIVVVGISCSLAAILPWWEILNPAPDHSGEPILLPLLLVRLWKATAPGTRLALLLDFLLLLVLIVQ
jgi:hypothetical protein